MISKLLKSNKNIYSYLIKLWGTSIIVCSGLILYLDKILILFKYQFIIPEKFISTGMNFQTFIWLISQTISPILLIIGNQLKTYKIAYIIPLYCYVLQFFFIFMDYRIIDNDYLYPYSIGSSIFIILIIETIKHMNSRVLKMRIEKEKRNLLKKKKL